MGVAVMGTTAKALIATALAATVLALVTDNADARRRGRPHLHLGPGLSHGQRAPDALSRETLRYCVSLEKSINARSDSLEETDNIIELQRALIDRTDPALVDGFNALVLEYQEG